MPRRMDSADHSLEYPEGGADVPRGDDPMLVVGSHHLADSPGGDGVLTHLEGDRGSQGTEIRDQIRPGPAVWDDDNDAGGLIDGGKLAEGGDGHSPSRVAGLETVGELVIRDYEVAVIAEGGQFGNDRVEESPVSVALERGYPGSPLQLFDV